MKAFFNRSWACVRLAAGLALLLVMHSCNDGRAASRDPARSDDEQIIVSDDSWIAPMSSRAGSAPKAPGGTAAPSAGDRPWTILLRTYSSVEHAQHASEALQQIRLMSPRLAAARITETPEGSAVVFGSYASATDPGAQRDLKAIKEIASGQSKPFALAMLTCIEKHKGPALPFDLMQVREQFPNVDPLYTLQVAVWGDFDGGLSRAEVRRRAEEYCAKLRGQGFKAYVHHSDASGLSKVTVGVFDRTAVDAQANLASPEVEALRRQFPAHLVNGEPLQLPVRGATDKDGKPVLRTQRPQLVKVPK